MIHIHCWYSIEGNAILCKRKNIHEGRAGYGKKLDWIVVLGRKNTISSKGRNQIDGKKSPEAKLGFIGRERNSNSKEGEERGDCPLFLSPTHSIPLLWAQVASLSFVLCCCIDNTAQRPFGFSLHHRPSSSASLVHQRHHSYACAPCMLTVHTILYLRLFAFCQP